MKLSELLNILVVITGTSIQELAGVLSYDRSYISKWINDKALPSPSAWEDIKASLVDFFAAKLTDLDLQRLAMEWPLIRSQIAHGDKGEILAKVFESAFKFSTERDLLSRQAGDLKPALTILGRQRVRENIIGALTQNFNRLSQDTFFYYTGNIIWCFTDDYLDSNYINIMSPNSARIRFEVDLDACLGDRNLALKFLNRFFLLISSLTFLKFELFEKDPKSNQALTFVQKDQFAAWGFDLDQDVPANMFYVENPQTVQAHFQALEEDFSARTPIFGLEKDFLASIMTRPKNAYKNPPIIYMPRLYLYYGSSDLREKMYQDRFINKIEYDLWGQVHQILKRPEIKQAKIIISKSYLNDTFKRGWVYKANGGLQLFGDYYKSYMEDLFAFFDSDQIQVIDNDKIENNYRMPTSIIYSDGAVAFAFQFNMMAPYDGDRILYKSEDPRFTHCVYQWLLAISQIESHNFLTL